MNLKQFAFRFIVFMLITALLPVLLQLFKPLLLISAFWKLFILFNLLTAVVCVSCLVGNQKGSLAGTQIFLVATVLKMLMCMVFIAIYTRQHEVNAIQFVCNFFYLYILNTVFELSTLLRNLRLQNPK
ncbi:MAG: hypothetical protein EOP42_13405 [Sphingobacteriaceae bacterium]|nr:MAG: hypothetical protein EOP42_13405 [Sphingobacteriaceae bacterium]